jgi:negative regulator of flagellin synthesis FlgM
VKIDDPLKKTGGVSIGTTQTRSSKGADKSGTVAKAPAQSDSVHLSSTVQSLTQASSNGVFDAKKVEEIKAAIANGTFKVDPEKVANGLLDTVNDLIHTRKA